MSSTLQGGVAATLVLRLVHLWHKRFAAISHIGAGFRGGNVSMHQNYCAWPWRIFSLYSNNVRYNLASVLPDHAQHRRLDTLHHAVVDSGGVYTNSHMSTCRSVLCVYTNAQQLAYEHMPIRVMCVRLYVHQTLHRPTRSLGSQIPVSGDFSQHGSLAPGGFVSGGVSICLHSVYRFLG